MSTDNPTAARPTGRFHGLVEALPVSPLQALFGLIGALSIAGVCLGAGMMTGYAAGLAAHLIDQRTSFRPILQDFTNQVLAPTAGLLSHFGEWSAEKVGVDASYGAAILFGLVVLIIAVSVTRCALALLGAVVAALGRLLSWAVPRRVHEVAASMDAALAAVTGQGAHSSLTGIHDGDQVTVFWLDDEGAQWAVSGRLEWAPGSPWLHVGTHTFHQALDENEVVRLSNPAVAEPVAGPAAGSATAA